MKLDKKNTINIVICSIILIVSAILMILAIAIKEFTLFSHPILAFLFSLNVGLVLLNLVNGIIYKSTVCFMLFSATLLYVATYSLIEFANLIWWAIAIIDVVIVILGVFLSLLVAGNKTEDIALNEKPEYKNYQQRKAERELEESGESVELPKIKSFEDK